MVADRSTWDGSGYFRCPLVECHMFGDHNPIDLSGAFPRHPAFADIMHDTRNIPFQGRTITAPAAADRNHPFIGMNDDFRTGRQWLQ